jgi:hypothetical protein
MTDNRLFSEYVRLKSITRLATEKLDEIEGLLTDMRNCNNDEPESIKITKKIKTMVYSMKGE